MEFYERLVYIARNFIEYGNYGGNKLKALKVVKKYSPEKSPEECAFSFEHVCTVYENAIAFARQNREMYFSSPKSNTTTEFNILE